MSAIMFINDSAADRDKRAATLGHAVYLLQSTQRASLSLATLQAWLRVPIRLDQIMVLFGDNQTPEGYLTWAYVTEPTMHRLAAGNGRPPLPEEWNDGTLLWLVDVVAPFGQLLPLLSAFKAQVLERNNRFGYISRRNGKRRLVQLRDRSA